MATPHKHADVIKAWADGAVIEVQTPRHHGAWVQMRTDHPEWLTENEYRVKRKWQAEMDAQKAGKAIQGRSPAMTGGEWQDGLDWAFFEEGSWDYRIKPEPHKWQACLDAQKAGKQLQARWATDSEWTDQHPGSTWLCNDLGAEYRIKPAMLRYRLVVRRYPGSTPFVDTVVTDYHAGIVENGNSFVRWVGDWVEIEA